LLLLIFRQFTARKKQQQQKEREREGGRGKYFKNWLVNCKNKKRITRKRNRKRIFVIIIRN